MVDYGSVKTMHGAVGWEIDVWREMGGMKSRIERERRREEVSTTGSTALGWRGRLLWLYIRSGGSSFYLAIDGEVMSCLVLICSFVLGLLRPRHSGAPCTGCMLGGTIRKTILGMNSKDFYRN